MSNEKEKKEEDIPKYRKPTHNLIWFHRSNRSFVHPLEKERNFIKLWGVQLEALTPLAKKITSPLMAAKNNEP